MKGQVPFVELDGSSNAVLDSVGNNDAGRILNVFSHARNEMNGGAVVDPVVDRQGFPVRQVVVGRWRGVGVAVAKTKGGGPGHQRKGFHRHKGVHS